MSAPQGRDASGMGRGSVVAFDPDVGLGEVRTDGGATFLFHCAEILDGSRNIAVGAEVSFKVVAGHRGRWEARALEPLGA